MGSRVEISWLSNSDAFVNSHTHDLLNPPKDLNFYQKVSSAIYTIRRPNNAHFPLEDVIIFQRYLTGCKDLNVY